MKDCLSHMDWCGVLYEVLTTTSYSPEEALNFVSEKYDDRDDKVLPSFCDDSSAGFYD